MLNHVGTIEAGANQFEVRSATSFLDLTSPGALEPFIAHNKDLFVRPWKGPTEALALFEKQRERVRAAAVLRYLIQGSGEVDVYVFGDAADGEDMSVLQLAIHDRVEARRAVLAEQQKGTITDIHANLHWGVEPPTLEIKPDDPGVGIEGFRALVAEQHEKFMRDLQEPYGALFPKSA